MQRVNAKSIIWLERSDWENVLFNRVIREEKRVRFTIHENGKIHANLAEMKFHLRRGRNWIFGFREKISDTLAGKKKPDSVDPHRRIMLQFPLPG